MTTKRKYKYPPVQEALCEIFFTGSEWDNAIPGSFYEEIKAEFPQKTQLKQFGVEVNIADKERLAKFSENEDRIQFRKPDGSQIIQLARDLLVINQLRPYPQFEAWLPVIEKKLDLYMRLVKPKGIVKTGVRYINRIVIPKREVRMEDYFNLYPQLPEGLSKRHGPFMMRLELPPKYASHQLVITFATAPADTPDSIAFALDLYDIFGKPIENRVDQLIQIVKEGHENIELAFENSIKEDLRIIFQEEKK